MINIHKINKAYNTNLRYLDRDYLERGLLSELGSYSYQIFRYEGIEHVTITSEPNWGSYEKDISICTEDPCITRDEAITRLFVKYADDERLIRLIKIAENNQ